MISRQRTRKNKAPEKHLTVDPLLRYMRGQGWVVDVIESKAIYSRAAGCYRRGPMAIGWTDIVGCDLKGTAVFVEAKAPGKRSTLADHQREFIEARIRLRAFGACVDSVELLIEIYETWAQLPPSVGVEYLIRALPERPRKRVNK